jgi:hypothetical protein
MDVIFIEVGTHIASILNVRLMGWDMHFRLLTRKSPQMEIKLQNDIFFPQLLVSVWHTLTSEHFIGTRVHVRAQAHTPARARAQSFFLLHTNESKFLSEILSLDSLTKNMSQMMVGFNPKHDKCRKFRPLQKCLCLTARDMC